MERQNRMPKTNERHILYDRTAYESNPSGLYLRRKMGLIALMDVQTHQQTHDEVSAVPLLDHLSLERTLSIMKKRKRANNPLDAMDNFMLAVEKSCQHPRAHELDRQLGELTVKAVYAQKPFVKDGMIKARVFDLNRRLYETNETNQVDSASIACAP